MRKRIHRIQALLLTVMLMLMMFSPVGVKAEEEQRFMLDYAGLISQEQSAELETKLDELGQKYEMHFVIVTDDDSGVTSPMEYADDFFDYNGYGAGTDRSGTLLYINLSTRDWWISTRGYGITAFTDAGIQYIGEQITEYLGDGDYYEAFETYVTLCDDFVAQAKTGEPYDVGNMPKEPYPFSGILLISLAAGLIVALIYILVLRGQLKSVAPNESAADYVVKGSLHVTNSREFFLYHTLHRTVRAESSSSGGGGGSSTHRSSSGATHGGGGGSF